MAWPCFWVEENGEAEFELRRLVLGSRLADEVGHFHQASASIGLFPVRKTEEDAFAAIPSMEFDGHPAWPTTCEVCSYEFGPDDLWQVNQRPVYVRPDTGETWSQPQLPVGALYDSPWYGRCWGKGADGIALMCILPKRDGTPDHAWHVDGPARGEGGEKPNAWTRTGDPRAVPPTVDVNPSILTNEYHGYLRNGVLTDPV